jgi:Holliday junction resolvase
MGKSKNKNLGSAFEYRCTHWFQAREGWKSIRIPLSGASESITESIGGHDVKAWHENRSIFLTIECKKRSRVKDEKKRSQIEIKSEWINKLQFQKDEILVVATDRSDMYVILPTKRFQQILGRSLDIAYDKSNIYAGDKQFVFKRESVDESSDKRYHLQWLGEGWTILLLDEFVTLRETANLDDKLSIEDQIKRLTVLEKAQDFEKINLPDLSYNQKRLLYSKLQELESGSVINPIAHSNDQFWLGDEAFVIACPFCKEKITKKNLKEIPQRQTESKD